MYPRTIREGTSVTDALSWLHAFVTAAQGEELTEEEREAVLALAGEAAHSSERTAAPLACWVAAAAGLGPLAALEIARSLTIASDQDGDEPVE